MKKRMLRITAAVMGAFVTIAAVPAASPYDIPNAYASEPFSIDMTKMTLTAGTDDSDNVIYVNGGKAKSFTSSNSKVVKVKFEKNDPYMCYLDAVKPGIAVITATGTDGTVCRCNVTVVGPAIVLNKNRITMDRYDFYESDHSSYCLYEDSADMENELVQAVSSDTSVVRVGKISEDGSVTFLLFGMSAGSAAITVTDKYGTTKKVPVTVTQRYADEKKYLPDLSENGYDDMKYGAASFTIDTSTDEKTSLKATINGKTYNGRISSGHIGKIKNIPVVKVGTKVKITLQRGKAKYSFTVKVRSNKPGIKASAKSKKVSGYVKHLHKGDYLKIKAGKKTYQLKKRQKNTSKYKFSRKIRKQKKGAKVTIFVYNKYKQKLSSKTIKVK